MFVSFSEISRRCRDFLEKSKNLATFVECRGELAKSRLHTGDACAADRNICPRLRILRQLFVILRRVSEVLQSLRIVVQVRVAIGHPSLRYGEVVTDQRIGWIGRDRLPGELQRAVEILQGAPVAAIAILAAVKITDKERTTVVRIYGILFHKSFGQR